MSNQYPRSDRSRRVLAISDRVYCILLAAYPAAFRERYCQEMAQVFRTCCRAAYKAGGASGVARLWPAILWDWVGSAVDEWVSRIFAGFNVKDPLPWFGHKVRLLIIGLIVCLPVLCCYPACGLFVSPLYWGIETCGLDIDNQSGQTLRVTPLDPAARTPQVRIYRSGLPPFPSFQQRDFIIRSGEVRKLSYDCDGHGPFVMYACDLHGECYVNKNHEFLRLQVKDYGEANTFNGFHFNSLQSLPRPDAALQATFQSLPEHDYTGLAPIPFAILYILILVFGAIRGARVKTAEIPKT